MQTDRDLPLGQIAKMMENILEDNPHALCYVKWTCPACGERVTSTEANTIRTGGMIHDELSCGYHYTGDLYGLFVEFSLFGYDAMNG